jgi:hypothetical protein
VTALRAAAAAALLAAAAAGAGEPHAAPAPRRAAPAREKGAAPGTAEARAATRPAPERPRVTPGVLVRAAKRAQEREAAACGPCAAQEAAQSIEIEWRAAPATP